MDCCRKKLSHVKRRNLEIERGIHMFLKYTTRVFILMTLCLLLFTMKNTLADGQGVKEAELLNISLGEYKEKVVDEKNLGG